MLLKGFHQVLVEDREKTFLTAPVTAAVVGSKITVKAIDVDASNNLSWADNDYIIIGEIGTEGAEIMQIKGDPVDGTSLTIDRLGTDTGTRFTHSLNDPVYRIDYNQIEFSRAPTIAGTKGVLATVNIQPDQDFTAYEDTTNTTGFGFIRFKNATTTTYSSYSIGVPYTGYPAKSLFRMIKDVRRLLNEKKIKKITDEDIVDELNVKQRDVYHERLWSFAETDFSFSAVDNTAVYDVPSRLSKVHTLAYDSQPLAFVSQRRWEMLHFDTNTSGDPTHFSVFGEQIKTYPFIGDDATADELDGAITATATTITLADVSDFRAPGRVIIDSEVIAYDAIDTDDEYLLGCRRGLEGTTAILHLDEAVVTERDFVGTGHQEPVELVDMNDETGVPDPRVLVYGASMELALLALDEEGLHDRLKIKYAESLQRLRDKFGQKVTGSFHTIQDKSTYPSDSQGLDNPQDFPQNLT